MYPQPLMAAQTLLGFLTSMAWCPLIKGTEKDRDEALRDLGQCWLLFGDKSARGLLQTYGGRSGVRGRRLKSLPFVGLQLAIAKWEVGSSRVSVLTN